MRVVAFRHVPFEDLGLIAPALAGLGIDYVYADPHRPGAVIPDVSDADGLIFMGGPMSVNDDLAHLRAEEVIIRDAVARGVPVLGVCLGSQLIARALGARVYRNQVKEIGWFDIEFTEAAGSDVLFTGLPHPETVFHWHGETFDLPPGAVWLARSRACAHQAYRVGSNVYGLQFHLEVTPAIISDWCTQDANCGDVRELNSPIDPEYNANRLVELSALVFGRWAALVRARA